MYKACALESVFSSGPLISDVIHVIVLDVTGLGRAMRNEGSFTVFAPTDRAFAALDSLALDRLLQNTDCLASTFKNTVNVTRSVLKY